MSNSHGVSNLKKMKIKIEKVRVPLLLSLFLFPALTFAASLADLVKNILSKVFLLPPLFFSIAFAYFIYGLMTFVISADEKKRTEGRYTVIYGLMGLTVMTAVWGLVAMVRGILQI